MQPCVGLLCDAYFLLNSGYGNGGVGYDIDNNNMKDNSTEGTDIRKDDLLAQRTKITDKKCEHAAALGGGADPEQREQAGPPHPLTTI